MPYENVIGNSTEIPSHSVSANGSPIASVIALQTKISQVESGVNIDTSVVLVNVVEDGPSVSRGLEMDIARELGLELSQSNSPGSVDGELPVEISFSGQLELSA